MATGRNIKGITIEIGGDTTGLQKALSGVNDKGYEYNRYEGEDRVVGFRKIAYDEEYIAETEKLIEEREEI